MCRLDRRVVFVCAPLTAPPPNKNSLVSISFFVFLVVFSFCFSFFLFFSHLDEEMRHVSDCSLEVSRRDFQTQKPWNSASSSVCWLWIVVTLRKQFILLWVREGIEHHQSYFLSSPYCEFNSCCYSFWFIFSFFFSYFFLSGQTKFLPSCCLQSCWWHFCFVSLMGCLYCPQLASQCYTHNR